MRTVWNASITIYDHGDEQSYSIRMWKDPNRGKGFLSPVKRVTGRMRVPVSTDPTRALRELLEALLADL